MTSGEGWTARSWALFGPLIDPYLWTPKTLRAPYLGLRWDQSRLDGTIFRVQHTRYHMSGDDILDYVRTLLEDEEE